MDEKVFKSDKFQCSYQYLRRSAHFQNLARFNFISGSIEGTVPAVLELLLE